jgi:hypothetical protein
MSLPSRQRGVALITAVLVVSIAVIAATAVLDAGNDAIQRGATFQDSERAWWYAAGCEDYVQSLLDRDQSKDVDGLGDEWNQVNGVLPVAQGEGEGALRGKLVDLQGRFNLNNLGAADDKYREVYQRQFVRLIAGIEDLDQVNGFPKSAHMAISQAKVVVASLVAKINGLPAPEPIYTNTCYSVVAHDWGFSVVHLYRVDNNQWVYIKSGSGISPVTLGTKEAPKPVPRLYRKLEAEYADGWLRNVLADAFG